MSKKSHKTKKRSQKSRETQGTDDIAFDKHEPEERTIVITVNSFKNITPIYPISDIKVHLKYLNQDLGQSRPVPVVYDEKLPLVVDDSFELHIDIASTKQLDLLASNPIYITALQSTGAVEPAMYQYLPTSEEESIAAVEDIDSLFSMYEMCEEKPPVQILADTPQKKKKGKKGETGSTKKDKSKLTSSKSSSDSKTTKTSKKTTKSGSKSKADTYVKTEIYGLCVIDLIPLFHGETSFSETLLMKSIKQSSSSSKNYPEISITVSIKDNAKFINITNILNFTVESICNVPSLMLSEMDCKICAMLPMYNLSASPIIFHNPKITTRGPSRGLESKRWPGLHDIGFSANTTKYFIADSLEEITNINNLNIEEAFNEGASRIEYNYLKRIVLYKSGKNELASHILTHRKIALEIYLTPKSKKDKPLEEQLEELRLSSGKNTKIPPHLHLLAVINVAALLYPGFTRLRIATPVTLFSYEEAAKAGLHDSFFLPKLKRDMPTGKDLKTKVEVIKKNKKSPEKKEKTSSKKDSKSLDSPPAAQVQEPEQTCEQVYNEAGKPCSILIEIELLNPLNPKMDIDDIKTNLHKLQLDALQSAHSVCNKEISDEHYDHTIKDIVDDLNQQWLEYNQVISTIPVPDYKMNFMEYLVRVGAYKSYTNSIITSVIYLMTNKYKCIEHYFKYHHKNYHNLLSELYAELIDKLHNTLNVIVCNEMRAKTVDRSIPWDLGYFYAKEAAELKLFNLAERYFMDRIIVSNGSKDTATFWIDFAIYNIEIKNNEKAFQCVREAIALNCSCKYALLLFGVLLTDKGRIQDAETCILNTLILDPNWVEGWCVLYFFYKKCDRPDGTEMTLEMGRKLIKGHCSDDEYLKNCEDLAWSWQNMPKSFFLNTAVLLLKMGLYSWVELALAEVSEATYYGYVQYLLAVVSYYKQDFEHALEYIKEAKESLGPEYKILALSGHILLAQSKLNEAQTEYFRIIESYNKPKNIHLVYLNCAEISMKLGNSKKAIKLILIACKSQETPHLWFSAGKLYYHQNDLLNAEECLTRANLKDNRHAEVWGYLTLVNLKLSKNHEAVSCYQQAVKSGLEDDELNQLIVQAFKKARR